MNFILTLANLDISKMYFHEHTNGKKFETWEEQIMKDLASLGMIRIKKYVSYFTQ